MGQTWKMRLESAFSVPVQLKCVGLGIVLTVAKKIHLVGWLAVARKKYAFGQVACSRSQKKMRLSQQIAKKNACEVLELFQGTKLSRIFCSDV